MHETPKPQNPIIHFSNSIAYILINVNYIKRFQNGNFLEKVSTSVLSLIVLNFKS